MTAGPESAVNNPAIRAHIQYIHKLFSKDRYVCHTSLHLERGRQRTKSHYSASSLVTRSQRLRIPDLKPVAPTHDLHLPRKSQFVNELGRNPHSSLLIRFHFHQVPIHISNLPAGFLVAELVKRIKVFLVKLVPRFRVIQTNTRFGIDETHHDNSVPEVISVPSWKRDASLSVKRVFIFT